MDDRIKDYPITLRYVWMVARRHEPQSWGEFLRLLVLSIKRDIEEADRRNEEAYQIQRAREEIIDWKDE